MQGFTIADARVRHERVPVAHPIKTAFGVMRERHAVLLLLVDEAGRQGLGESWVNFPAWAACERVAAFEKGFIPYLLGRCVDDVPAFVAEVGQAFVGAARQSGTIGPMVQALCAIELALWDLEAQRTDVPLAQHLFERPHSGVRVYASGLNSPIPWDLVDEHLDLGITLFKLKLGFGDDEDRRNLEALSNHLGSRGSMAVDVNRGWTTEQALVWLPLLQDHNVQWLEEPLVEAEEPRMGELRARSDVPIAGGENLVLLPGADVDEIARAEFDVLQPDLTKYAPLHVAKGLLDAAECSGKRVIPHFLGSAPGQAASLHFAAGCPDGLVELDINRNPLRTELFGEPFAIVDGAIQIPDKPGLGWRLRAQTTPR